MAQIVNKHHQLTGKIGAEPEHFRRLNHANVCILTSEIGTNLEITLPISSRQRFPLPDRFQSTIIRAIRGRLGVDQG